MSGWESSTQPIVSQTRDCTRRLRRRSLSPPSRGHGGRPTRSRPASAIPPARAPIFGLLERAGYEYQSEAGGRDSPMDTIPASAGAIPIAAAGGEPFRSVMAAQRELPP